MPVFSEALQSSCEKHCWKTILEAKVMNSCPIKSICPTSFTLHSHYCLLFYVFVSLVSSVLENLPPFLNLQLFILLTSHSTYQKSFFFKEKSLK